MAILDYLNQKEQWLKFYEYKAGGGHLSQRDLHDLKVFIDNEEYLSVIHLIEQGLPFPLPEMNILNKKNTNKKRTVFSFPREENYVLKFLAYLLLEYDSVFTPNLYSFRKHTGVKKAISNLTNTKELCSMYSYKADIHDYFNSVNISRLLPMLKELWFDETELYNFIESLLENPYVIKDGKPFITQKGIMAGIPISSFLANIYLRELDSCFWNNHILYARYSDDIIVFAHSEEELSRHIHTIHQILQKMDLEINPAKVSVSNPGEKWEFLGFSYHNGIIDISDIALQKIKRKLKRKARALYRWKISQMKSDEFAIRAYIKYFNRKFFDNPIHNEITWCKWYFPIINTDRTLYIIDHYMQNCIRYISTGRYTKANYNFRYQTMKQYGYRSLVNEYYRGKQNFR